MAPCPRCLALSGSAGHSIRYPALGALTLALLVFVSSGVGRTHLVLPRRGSYKATLETGVGATTVQLPHELAARVEVSQGVGTVTVRSDFERDGERYTTPDYGVANHQVELRVGGGAGAITIKQLD